MVISASTEEEAKENIATSLHIEMPQFYYWPYGMEYEDYIVDENAQTAIIQYRNGKSIFCFTIISNIQNASFFITSDSGEEIKNIKSQFMGEINSTLLKVMEEDDEQPTYILQWEYKNVYYELSGKILETEMEDIAENIIY